ncbi:transporter substrate-binding domain-containing protein [Pandoraea pulmonicola]|jgi:cystine transport system substrate-binding protein|uniref:Cysteine ABC transporter substrate-binding protein n=1 Tax=Pandoraea pulmonicola TaxID=93221 RepID=A0AAJ5D3C9_PANPU|nr:transporter substrate-binding domain-containing protein [Pandoraea pulmonicola]AJC22397.1 cysteine ABC transporter substrate-binding protein [Pandoraea pulmonicola]SUD95663.1 Sulfate starvation-induced protein 7 [Pandoraea pulmonicola]
MTLQAILCRIAGAAAFFCAAYPVAAGAQTVPADILAHARTTGVIRVANTQSSPPWSLLDDKLQASGYDVEVAKEVARRIGVPKVVFIADSYKNFVDGLKVGKYDLVMNDLTPTAEREKQIDFSAPYGVEEFRIFVLNTNRDIKDKPDLKGKRVGVTTGSSNETWARANLKDSDIRTYDNGGFLFNDMGNGRLDAVISSHFGGMKYATVNKVPIKEVGKPLTYQLSAAGMVKGQQPLKAAVNKAVADMLADGTIDRLARKWVGADYDMIADIKEALKQQ